jgi:hypothetical protein
MHPFKWLNDRRTYLERTSLPAKEENNANREERIANYPELSPSPWQKDSCDAVVLGISRMASSINYTATWLCDLQPV